MLAAAQRTRGRGSSPSRAEPLSCAASARAGNTQPGPRVCSLVPRAGWGQKLQRVMAVMGHTGPRPQTSIIPH